MASNDAWWIGTDNKIVLEGLKRTDGTFLNNAGLIGTLKSSTGENVEDGTDIMFSYVQDSDGNYEALLPASATGRLMEKQKYTLFIQVVDDPDGQPDNDDDRKALLRMIRKAQYIDI